MIYFPGSYYILSRYNGSVVSFAFHLLRYWFILFFSLNTNLNISITLKFLYALTLFFITYDYFCYINDKNAEHEIGSTKRLDKLNFSYSNISVILWLFCMLCLHLRMEMLNSSSVFVILLIICIFFFHNLLFGAWRAITFTLLYILKVMLIFSVISDDFCMILSDKVFWGVSLLWNLVYIYAYTRKKLDLEKLKNYNVQLIRWISIALLIFVLNNWYYYLVVLVFIYVIEFVYRKFDR